MPFLSNLFQIFSDTRKPLQPKQLPCSLQNRKNYIHTFKTNLLIFPKLPTRTSIMSDKRRTYDKLLIILQNAEDYPNQWSYAVSKIQQQSYNQAITDNSKSTLESVQTALMKKDFMLEEFKPATFVAALRDEMHDYYIGLIKSANLIKKLVNKSLHLFLNDKNTAKM